jgi:hypothetical protein
MPQNLISVDLSDADYAEIDAALATLARHFATLIDLSAEERRNLTKMGDKSESFCRQALVTLDQNRQLLPPNLDLAEAQRDLQHLDRLRARLPQLQVLHGKLDDTIMALGSDVMTTSLEGYALLKVMGQGSGLEALRQGMSARFARRGSKAAQPQ